MDEWICPKCGRENEYYATYCVACSAPRPTDGATAEIPDEPVDSPPLTASLESPDSEVTPVTTSWFGDALTSAPTYAPTSGTTAEDVPAPEPLPEDKPTAAAMKDATSDLRSADLPTSDLGPVDTSLDG